ncbi:Cyclopentanol dehydrogenase [Hyphodiscus hymeniophilus]|uniref:Cyclopentanol dehydrogenase n=1 Tax=Hyphodiscus hymeniophilus TaxID=353542 RepID=A0A9P6VDF4_9HELO|nr:Cyclopentanol dehydrogenase [Hyphodiscus hymeniophilus]
MASLSEKVFIVTGSASGMGLATAKTLLSRGASLGLCDNSRTRSSPNKVDVTSRSALNSFFEATKQRFGKIDGIANIAGTGGYKLGNKEIWMTSDEEFDFIVNLNVKGLFHVLSVGLKPGILEEPGSIVHITSMFGERGYPKGGVFSVSKHAANGMIKSVAMEAGKRRVRVNAVLPGAVDTLMLQSLMDRPNTPLIRLGQPKEIGHVVAFLLSDEASFVTSATWRVDGGANA